MNTSGSPFTSGLSVAEFAVSEQMQLRPLAQVMGSCVYQVGWQYAPRQAAYGVAEPIFHELDVLTEAFNEARGSAVARLAQEGRKAGADAVVAVGMRSAQYDWAAESVEFVLTGTAVSDPSLRGDERPVLSDLSAQEYCRLSQAGFQSCGLVAATSCFFIVRGAWARQMQTLTFARNQETPEYTQGVYMARETALERLTEQIRAVGGEGVVGVKITHSIGQREFKTSMGGAAVSGLAVTFHAIGTAIRAVGDTPAYPPQTAIDLSI